MMLQQCHIDKNQEKGVVAANKATNTDASLMYHLYICTCIKKTELQSP